MADPGREIADAERLARRAGELGKDDAVALASAGIALATVVGDLDSAAAFTDRAIELNPNLAWGWLFSGLVRVWLGEAEAALERIQRAMRLSPHDPHIGTMRGGVAWAHFVAGRYDEALSFAQAGMREQPNLMFTYCVAAASAALGGRLEVARQAMAQIRRRAPSLRMSNLRAFFPTRRPEDFARWEEGLRLAGLPD
jgi:tetratricopeptide (TPR) repeat protein